MTRKPLTERQLQLKEAQAQYKEARRHAAIAKRRLDELSKCDWCGAKTTATGEQVQLCGRCYMKQLELNRIAVLAKYGYGPDGKRLPKDQAA